MAACSVCPKCRSDQVVMTLPSQTGAYCQCQKCGHLWHDDESPLFKGPPELLRRKSDRRRSRE